MTVSCPWCFQPRDPERPVLACTQCEPEFDEQATVTLGRQVTVRPSKTVPRRATRSAPRDEYGTNGQDPQESRYVAAASAAQAATCDRCHGPLEEEVCSLCRQTFPAGWTALSGTTTIALAGARNTGKTVYIDVVAAAALHELATMIRKEGARITIVPADADTRDAEAESRKRLWDDRRLAESTRESITQTAPPPIRCYLLTRRFPGYEQRHGLVLRDVAGEDLENSKLQNTSYFGFLGRADLMVFLVDPLKVHSIRDRLEALLDVAVDSLGEDPLHVLQNVVLLQGSHRPAKTAVVFAKFDTVQHLADGSDHQIGALLQSRGFAFNRDPGAVTPGYQHRDSVLLDAEIRSLLEYLGGDDFLAHVDMHVKNPRFFAVSALGHQPVGAKVGESGITAFRVLDPIKWGLADSGILDPDPPPSQPIAPAPEPTPEPPKPWWKKAFGGDS